VWLICITDIIASGIQQEQNSESTDVDEPFSPSTKETFDIDSTSPQTFSAMSDSVQSDRQHGALSAEAAAVDTAAEVDLVDSASANLLFQSLDITTSAEVADKVHEPTVLEPVVMEVGATRDTPELKEKREVEDQASVDDKPSQEECQQSDTESRQDVAHEETLDVVALRDEDIPGEDTTRLQSASDQPANASDSVDTDKVTQISTTQSSSEAGAAFDSDVAYSSSVDVVNTDVDTVSQSARVDEPSELHGKQTTRDIDSSFQEDNFGKTVEEGKTHFLAQDDLSYQEEISTDVKQKFEEHEVGVTEALGDGKLHDDELRKSTKVVPQISISVCSSGNAEDNDDLPYQEDTSIPEQLTEEDATSLTSDHQAVMTTESLLCDEETKGDAIARETESTPELELQATEPATPEVERNLSQYHLQREKETHEASVTVEHERHDRKEITEGLTEAQQLHDAKLLCSSTESMVSSTTSDWTVIDIRDEPETVESFYPIAYTDKDVSDTLQQRVDEYSFSTPSYTAHTELAVSQESRDDVLEVKDEAFIGGLDEIEDEDEEIDAVENYLTATVTPTVDLMVMSTALESILEEEERTSSSQKTTSSSEKLEHDVSDSSKLVGSSPDVQHAESPTFQPAGKFTSGKSSDRDDVSVSSSLAEFERLERDLQEKGSSESFSGDKGSSESASAVAPPESPQRKSSTSLSSSLAEFERIEHEILGQSGSLELITIDRKSHHTDSSSFSELERIEEMDKTAEEQFRSSSGSLAEFEYIEQHLRLNEELESEALKVATMLEKSRASSAEKSPEAGSSQSDVRLSKEQIPDSAESVSAEETAPPAPSAEAQYPHYQDIVHIIREASRNEQTFQFSDPEASHTSTATETVSHIDGITRLQQETTSESYHTVTSSVKTTWSEDVSATASDSISRTEQTDVVKQTDEVRSVVELRSVSASFRQDFSYELEPEKSYARTVDSHTEDREIRDLKSVEETDAVVSSVVASKELSETVGESSEPVIQQPQDADLMTLSTDSLIEIQSEDVMQLSTDSLQPDAAMMTSTDSLEIPDGTDICRSSTSTLSSATTLLAAEKEDEQQCLMERSSDSLESDSREPSGEWVTVYEADSVRECHEEKTAEGEAIAESTDSLEAEFSAGSDHQLVGDDAGVVSGSASYESFEADSLQDEVEEEPTLVSSQSQDSLLVACAATIPMDISFGSSGAWSQSNVSSCTTLASSSDGETLTYSADMPTPSGGGAADRRLSEPSSSTPPTAWSYAPGAAPLSVDNTQTVLDSEGNVLIAAVSDESRTPRLADVGVGLDNRQSSMSARADKQSVSQTADCQPVEPTGFADETEVGETSAAVDVPPGIL